VFRGSLRVQGFIKNSRVQGPIMKRNKREGVLRVEKEEKEGL
jgi:hypothetical protein